MKNISQKVVRLLKKKRFKISFAESCTGGLLSSSITSINGSSKVFEIGLVTYSNKSKISTLKVPKKTIMKHGAVSFETCLSMVKNLNKISKTNISVSITGIAGPKGKTKKKPVGLVFIGIKKGNKTIVRKCLFKNKKRTSIQKAAVNKSLNLILSFIK
jgi:PncC family amidohydrolase